MSKDNPQEPTKQEINETVTSTLETVLRNGARKMLQEAIEVEVDDFINTYKDLHDTEGKRLAVRNGHMPERDFLTSMGPIKIKQPRVDDRKLRKDVASEFTSRILPKYMRRAPSIDCLVPTLYLKGISTQDFPTALSAILGDDAKGLSSTTVVRLKEVWQEEYRAWSKTDLSEKKYAYIWVDGIYFNVRLKGISPCILVVIGADIEGNKELLAVYDGLRESEMSWHEVLLDLKARGLSTEPSLAIGDGSLGFWNALRKVYPGTREQRCWVHKTANLLDKLPKKLHGQAKGIIYDMYFAPDKKTALKAYDKFIELYSAKYPKATGCLEKDIDQLFTFYDFPAIHWQHIRTTNPIESTFATVRLRTKRTKGCGSVGATLTMVFKLAREAEKRWRKLRGYKMVFYVMAGEKFIDGEPENENLIKLAA
jgi:putative transposase